MDNKLTYIKLTYIQGVYIQTETVDYKGYLYLN